MHTSEMMQGDQAGLTHSSAADVVFAGRGETRACCRRVDWSATPVGSVETWPASLRTIVTTLLAAPIGMIVLWGPRLVQIYNDGYREVMGAKHPAGLGQPTQECWPEVWDFNAPIFDGVMQRGETFTFTDQRLMLARNGEPAESYFTLSFSPVPTDDGTIGGVLATVAETTKQVLARVERDAELERLLTASEVARANVTATFESISDAFYAMDSQFRFTYVNRKAEALWGRPRETLIGREYVSEFPQIAGSESHQKHNLVMSERKPERYETVSPILGRWIDVAIYPDDSSGGLSVYFRDITERKAAEEELRASEARYRLALDVAELGTWTWDLTTGMGDLDARGAEIVGLPAGDLANVVQAQLASIHPDDLASVQAASAEGIAHGQPFSLAYRVIYPDGSVHHVASRARVLTDHAGQPVRLVGTNRDVTAERVAEAERERLLAEAEAARREAEVARDAAAAANRAKGEFLAVMSHELRTPLNAIGGYAELIELGLRGPVTDAQRMDLARIQQSQRHLLGLINQVLNYTRIDAGAVRYDITVAAAAAALGAAEALVLPQVRARGLTYVLGACAPGLSIRADQEKLQQILLNLLSNAIKFTEPGGQITVLCIATTSRVEITVADTGVGIAPEKLASIFEPFVQVDQRLTRPHEGVGLGLAISRELARGMGGDLTANSTVGTGSVFTLELPLA